MPPGMLLRADINSFLVAQFPACALDSFLLLLIRPAASGGSLVSQHLIHNSGALRPCVYRASESGRS